MHTQTAARMLQKAGLDVDALECGVHWPYNEDSARALAAEGRKPTALNNNCSGKHAGFLCLACALHSGPDLRQYVRGYVAPDHPVMREVSAALQATTGFDLAAAPRGTDGCSIPTFAIPLHNLALAFARVATGQGLRPGRASAARRLRAAVARAPLMVSGTGRFDSRVMERLGERVFCKVGAEGVVPRRAAGTRARRRDQDGRRQQRARLGGRDGGGDRGPRRARRRRGRVHARLQRDRPCATGTGSRSVHARITVFARGVGDSADPLTRVAPAQAASRSSASSVCNVSASCSGLSAADPQHAREAHRDAALVARAPVDALEAELEHHRRLDAAHRTELLERGAPDRAIDVAKLFVGQPE